MMTKMIVIAKWMLYLLVFSFLGLMVVQWGANYSGIRRQSKFMVGKINGHEISKDEFDRAIQQAYENERQRTGEELTDEQVKQIRDQVWEDYVRRILLSKEIEKLDIRVTKEDIVNYIVNNPPQAVTQSPDFQTNGKFDRNKYLNALRAPENTQSLIYQEQVLQSELPYLKLEQLIRTSVMVSEEEVRDEFMRRNLKASIEYLFTPVAAFRDDSVSVSNEEIIDYYQQHKEEFKQDELRQLNYVLFSTEPTAADSADIYKRAENIKKEALEGKDFAELADLYSDDPSVTKNHGDLGYFEKRTMVKEFSDAAFSAKPGDIIGPVKTQFGLHIIKVIDRKVENGTVKVRASHILLKFEPSRYTVDNAYEDASSFAQKAAKKDFSAVADEAKLEIKHTPDFSKNKIGNIPGVGRLKSAMMWAFDQDEGAVSDVFKFPQGYVVFEVAKIIPAGYKPLDSVREICKRKVQFLKQKELARQYALKWQPLLNENPDFGAVAAGDTAGILKADSTGEFTMKVFVPKIGKAPAVVAAAFTLPIGEVSGLLEADRGFYYIRVKKRSEFDEDAYTQQREQIRNQLLQQKQRTVFTQWYEHLKEKADIMDHRYLFYRS